MKRNQKGFSTAEMIVCMVIIMTMGMVAFFASSQAYDELNKFLTIEKQKTMDNGDFQVTVANNANFDMKNMRLSCVGNTPAGDTVSGDVQFYEALPSKQTVVITSSELIQENFIEPTAPHKLSLKNVKNLTCTKKTVEKK